MINSYVSIDLETTGLNPRLDKIIEIGAVKVIDGEAVGSFSTFVRPGVHLEEKVTVLTGITDADLEGAPVIEEALPELLEFLGQLPLLGHSILFDFSFLKKAAVNQRLTFEKEAIDTLKIARRYLNGLECRTLEYLCAYYGIPHQAHRALADAEACNQLYRKLAALYDQEEDGLFQPSKLAFKVKRETPATEHQKERLYQLIKKHKLIIGYDVEMLSRSEASRYTDRILAEYGR